ncbi:hypothetical protein BCR34DRAFT_590791 [Clohesyomyces aquaticus]|uniref:PNPLA domain-containing protein n=1 Tax=Clohesyomyces aquaticus TaxID=1231657 RepID=A0A1Y1Z6R5_9PLEO|nr:hypothetical protein BCR34DRAFT_590791 [Clohesyomyces aquaticus]
MFHPVSNSMIRCANVASTHSTKGHQNSKGKSIAASRYQSKFRTEGYYPVWQDAIISEIKNIHRDLKDRVQRELASVPKDSWESTEMPMVKHLVTMKHAAKYKTTPFRDVLAQNFRNDHLFGSNGNIHSSHVAKVAVTATDAAGKRAITLANYNHKVASKNLSKSRRGHYDFPRPGYPNLELKIIMESSRGHLGSTVDFKPFHHPATKRTYLDGALYHNNSIRLAHRERKLLWLDVANRHPDIRLCLGTSQHEMKKNFPNRPRKSRNTRR